MDTKTLRPAIASDDRIAVLERENERLKEELERLRREIERLNNRIMVLGG